MSYRGRSNRSSGRDNDGKYLRLTGLWPNQKKDNLWTGKMRAEDVAKLIEKADEADQAGVDLVFFLWQNQEKNGRKDPDFTIQMSVADSDGGGRGRGWSGRDSGSRREEREPEPRNSRRREPEPEPEEEQQEEEPQEEAPRKASRGRAKEPEPARSITAKKTAKDEVW